MDRITLSDIEVRCILGLHPEERVKEREVRIDLSLLGHFEKAGGSDRIEDSVDYEIVHRKVVELARTSKCLLLENLAQRIAGSCLQDPRVLEVEVCVKKPGALPATREVSFSLTRSQTPTRPI